MKEVFIEIINGDKAGSRLKILGSKVLFGRASDCDIVINDNAVSRKHAEIVFSAPGSYVLNDLQSSNGVYISNKRISSHILQNQDIFDIGNSTYKFVEKELTDKIGFTSNIKIPSVQNKSNKKRFYIYGALGVFVLFLLLLSSTDNTETNTAKKAEPKTVDNSLLDDSFLKELEKDDAITVSIEPGMETFFEKASDYYFEGKRELRMHNYTRALDNFKKALTFYPKHNRARYFAETSSRLISQSSENHLKTGKKLMTQFRYNEAIFHFTEVLNLNYNNSKSNLFQEAEKYIKIAEEQKKKIRH